MSTDDSFYHLVFNLKLLDNSLEFYIDFTSSHLKMNIILMNTISKLVIKKHRFNPSSKSRFSIPL